MRNFQGNKDKKRCLVPHKEIGMRTMGRRTAILRETEEEYVIYTDWSQN